jgi:4-amino-4-deoxy-L-arabinose transferase-like glycosyltransferase
MTRSRVFLLIALLCFLSATFIRVNNNFKFIPAGGYDASGHLSYIYQMKSGWSIPLANEGWSTFHPPLYYFLMAGIWKALGGKSPWPVHIILRMVSTLLNLAIAILTLLCINLLWPEQPLTSILGICFILFVPVHIYSSSMIGNEQLTAFLISTDLWLLILYMLKPRLRSLMAILMGVFSGLALLSKYTGALILITIVICLSQRIIFNDGHRKKHVFSLLTIILICFLISGGYYVRNMLFFGNPFVLGQDYPVIAKVMDEQPPGDRQWSDFFGFDLRTFYDPIIRNPEGSIPISRSRYVWSLVYSDFWFDSMAHFLLLKSDPWRQRIGTILLWLGIFPIVLFILDVGKETAINFRERMNTPTFPLLVLLLLNLISFIIFNIKTPHFSAGKASYFLASSVPIAVFMALGTQRFFQKGTVFKMVGLFLLILIFGLSSAAFFLTYT